MFLLRRNSFVSSAVRNNAWLYRQSIISRSAPICYSTEAAKPAPAASSSFATKQVEKDKSEQVEENLSPIEVTRYTTKYNGEVVKIKNNAELEADNIDSMERLVLDGLFAKEETSVPYEQRLEKYCDYLSAKYNVMYKLQEYKNIINHFLNDLAVCTDPILATVLKTFIKLEVHEQGAKVYQVMEVSNGVPQSWYRTQTVAAQLYARNLQWNKSLQFFQNLLQNKQLNESLAKFMVQQLHNANEKERVTQVVSSLVANNYSLKKELATLCKEAVADNADLVAKISSK